MSVRVKNIDSAKYNAPPTGFRTWLEYWKKKQMYEITSMICYNIACDWSWGAEINGSLVQKCDSMDNRWFIVPLCRKCNSKFCNVEFDVIDELVPVNFKP